MVSVVKWLAERPWAQPLAYAVTVVAGVACSLWISYYVILYGEVHRLDTKRVQEQKRINEGAERALYGSPKLIDRTYVIK